MKSVRERMDIESAYREVGTFRGAAEICSTTPKTVRRVVLAARRTGAVPETPHNYDQVRDLVAARVEKTKARISAKRLLAVARAAGYGGSARNFRRLVADEKAIWRTENHRGRRPGVWEPGDVLTIDWGAIGPLHVFCAVLAYSRVRFVFFRKRFSPGSTPRLLLMDTLAPTAPLGTVVQLRCPWSYEIPGQSDGRP
jgi:transposase